MHARAHIALRAFLVAAGLNLVVVCALALGVTVTGAFLTVEEASWGVFFPVVGIGSGVAALVLLLHSTRYRPDVAALALFFITGPGSTGLLMALALLPDHSWLSAIASVGAWQSCGWLLSGAAFLSFSLVFPRVLTEGEFLRSDRRPLVEEYLASRSTGLGRLLGPMRGLARSARVALERLDRADPTERWVQGTPLALSVDEAYVKVILNPKALWTVSSVLGAALLLLARILPYPLNAVGELGMMIYPLCFVPLAVWNWRVALRRSTAAEAQRIYWILEASLVPIALVFLMAGVGAGGQAVLSADAAERLTTGLGIFGFPGAFGLWIGLLLYAVFGKGAIDPTLAIRRTTVYGALGVVFLFLLAGVGNLAESWVEMGLGLPGGTGTVVTGGGIAVALIPVKRRLDRIMNRLLPATVLAEAPTKDVAILFADLVGFMALTGTDQRTGLTVMVVFQKAAERVAREHRGRFVKAVADEVMVEFGDAGDAVRAAGALQEEFCEDAGKLDLPIAQVRTGIHFGTAARAADGDLFGDAVNIASRVHGVAGPGEVLLSGAVGERLDPTEFVLTSLGPKSLKNVPTPVPCFRLEGPWGTGQERSSTSTR